MATKVRTYSEALEDAQSRMRPRTVLLGNGFSIDWNHEIFDYERLMDEAEMEGLTASKDELFGRLGTADFERVVEFLTKAALLADLYATTDPDLVERLRVDADIVRNGLADVLAKRHPARPQAILDEESERAREFLAEFDMIFTVNYDLLLYWVLNRIDGTAFYPPRKDGFLWPTFHDRSTLVFKRAEANASAKVFWLHGGLHLFVESDRRLHKLAYSTEPIIGQLRDRLEDGQYPLVVTEGTSEDKRARIGRSAYLNYVNNRLRDLEGCLFVHGMSLSENDDHILESLSAKESDVDVLYVSIFGNKTTLANRRIINRAEMIAEVRKENGGRALEVQFYDSASAGVWR